MFFSKEGLGESTTFVDSLFPKEKASKTI